MKALSSIAPHAYTIQYCKDSSNIPRLLSCSRTIPFRIIAFKSRKHAQIVHKYILFEGQEVLPLTKTSYVLSKQTSGTEKIQVNNLNIVQHSLVDLCVKSGINNLQLTLIDDVADNRNNVVLYNQELTDIYIDPLMIRSNLEKLFS